MTVLSILVLVLLSMLGSLTSIWQEGQAHNERRTIAQAVLERMTRDISQAAMPLAQSNTNTLAFVINPSWLSITGANQQSIFFESPVATDGSGNALVGYYVKWVGASPGTPTLMRVLINPSDPSGSGTDYQVYSGPANAGISDGLLATYGAGTQASNYQGLLSENVLGVWIQALDANNTPIVQTGLATGAYDSRLPYVYNSYSGRSKGGTGVQNGPSTNTPSVLPASVQVAIAVIDSRSVRRLTNAPANFPPSGSIWTDVQNFYNNLKSVSPAAAKGTEIQTTTIPLVNGPR
jgi:hypothetical protein